MELVNTHCHCVYSGHGIGSIAEYADAAAAAGLDRARAVEVLSDDLYAPEVRAAQALWRARGISAVPAVVIEGQYLISGGQPAEVFAEALRKVAAA